MIYRPEIDGLRALAVLPVIFYHAGFELFVGGFVGVDIFFVISGYLITTMIISAIDKGIFSFYDFYERRARRILPALFFVMIVCIPFAWLWLLPNDFKGFGQSLVAVATFSSNILFWQESGYFDVSSELKPLLHTWSLAVEEQYYIIFPVLLMLAWRLGIHWVLVLLSIIFIISIGLAQWAAFNYPSANFYTLPTRAWELLVGVFAAFYLKYSNQIWPFSVNQLLSLVGLGMIIFSIISFDSNTPFPSLYTLIPTLGTGLIILCTIPNTAIHKLLSMKIFVGVGLISYSAYLWHQPLFAFTRHIVIGNIADSILIILCLTSFLLAWFSWCFIEQPFRDPKKVSTKKFINTILFATVFMIIMGASINYFPKSILSLNPLFNAQLEMRHNQEVLERKENIKAGICQYNANDGFKNIDEFLLQWDCMPNEISKDTILVFGDSTSADAANMLQNITNSIIQIGGAGCGAVSNLDQYSYCKNIRDSAHKLLKTGVRKVVLSNRWEYDQLKLENFIQIIDFWGQHEAEVIIMPPPIDFKNFRKAFNNLYDSNTYNLFDDNRGRIYSRIISENKLNEYGVRFLENYEKLCSNDEKIHSYCDDFFSFYNVEKDLFTRTDSFHLSNYGAQVLSQLLNQKAIF